MPVGKIQVREAFSTQNAIFYLFAVSHKKNLLHQVLVNFYKPGLPCNVASVETAIKWLPGHLLI